MNYLTFTLLNRCSSRHREVFRPGQIKWWYYSDSVCTPLYGVLAHIWISGRQIYTEVYYGWWNIVLVYRYIGWIICWQRCKIISLIICWQKKYDISLFICWQTVMISHYLLVEKNVRYIFLYFIIHLLTKM